jgi:hypothetical protein
MQSLVPLTAPSGRPKYAGWRVSLTSPLIPGFPDRIETYPHGVPNVDIDPAFIRP